MVVAVAGARAIMAEEDAEDTEEDEEFASKKHLKRIECFNCGKKGPRKNDNENSNMVSKADFKNLFQSSLKDMLTKKEKQTKKKDNMEVYDESLDMNVFLNSWKVSTQKL
jgi:ribosomal protein L13